MDPWGTSDPYVVLQLDSQILKSNVKWGTKEPTWNEDLTLSIKHPPTIDLQAFWYFKFKMVSSLLVLLILALEILLSWDANLVTPHKRIGNGIVSLESICYGNSHEVLVELEGMGGGGNVQLEVTRIIGAGVH
ncbi:unnamed protein product [Lactuca saligna]|uniref:C2 domain-containing protein n=1 Tax=Lactuca saligna TaxID=75948 RepID=A0AA36DWK8_LACSI|nr:unnamed protein product [Lactuca saligna]